jgi:hypothetical protein
MLSINPNIVCLIIGKAQQFHAKEEVVIPEDSPLSPSDDWSLQVLADHSEDPVYEELKATIDDLEPEQQIELVALMWVGRGDFDTSEWQDALRDATDEWTPRTADYLIATPLVADYLEEALNQMDYGCD